MQIIWQLGTYSEIIFSLCKEEMSNSDIRISVAWGWEGRKLWMKYQFVRVFMNNLLKFGLDEFEILGMVECFIQCSSFFIAIK